MKRESRIAFSVRQRKWFLHRDQNKCQATFPHICDTKNILQVHHIKPYGYLKRVAPDISAEFPENAITLCRTAHEMVHPDVVWARQNYNRDTEIFYKLRKQRSLLLDNRQIYWVDTWDRQMEVIALINTRKYMTKHPFPTYTRRKHEIIEDDEDGQTESL